MRWEEMSSCFSCEHYICRRGDNFQYECCTEGWFELRDYVDHVEGEKPNLQCRGKFFEARPQKIDLTSR